MAPTKRILAMDIATQAAVCFGAAGEIPAFATVRFHGEDRLQAAASVLRWCAKDLPSIGKPDVAYLEKPMSFAAAKGHSTSSTLIRLNSLYDIIGAALLLRGVEVVGVDVQKVRYSFIGDGKLEREAAKARALTMCRLLGWPAKNKDEADAAAVWHWGCSCESPRSAAIVHPGLWARAASIAAGEATLKAIGGPAALAGLRP